MQDEWQIRENLNITYGVRFDVPFFTSNAVNNPQVDSYSFVDEKGNKISNIELTLDPSQPRTRADNYQTPICTIAARRTADRNGTSAQTAAPCATSGSASPVAAGRTIVRYTL